jgi:hypothetical protein
MQHQTLSDAIAASLISIGISIEDPKAPPKCGFWVDVRPHPQAKLGFCDDNVALQIRDYDGSALCVWEFTHNPHGQFLEGTAHFIWQSPIGSLLDVGLLRIDGQLERVKTERISNEDPDQKTVPWTDAIHVGVQAAGAGDVAPERPQRGPSSRGARDPSPATVPVGKGGAPGPWARRPDP